MSRAGPVSRPGSVCRDDSQPGFSTNDLDHLFCGNLVVIFLHLCSWMGYFTSTFYLERGTWTFLIGYRARKRNLMLARLAGLAR